MPATILPPPPSRASLLESLKPAESGGGEFDLITTRSGFQGLQRASRASSSIRPAVSVAELVAA
jgi:hypothetical protein